MIFLFILGRVLFGGFFLMNGINHLRHIESLTEYTIAKKVPQPKIAVIGTGILLIASGLSFILGYYPTWGIIGLIIFLIPTTFIMHNFWTIKEPMARMNNQINFSKNMALLGASIMFLFMPMPSLILLLQNLFS